MIEAEEMPGVTHRAPSEGARRPAPPRRRRLLPPLIAGLAVLAAAGVAVLGIASRNRGEAALAQWTDAQAVPTVAVVRPEPEKGAQTLRLPGDIEAFYQAPIYARVSGYLKNWRYDIGAHVKAGDELATIETPDLDQQLDQARANLATAQANERLAALTAKRWQQLLKSNSVSQQDADEKRGDADAKAATVRAAEAEVQRLEAMKGFARLVAPFDGVVTARWTDVGALINAGSGNGRELFAVSDLHRMRIYVHVPQAYAAAIKPGVEATFVLPQYPDQIFTAGVVTTSNAVDPRTRTMLVELQIDNRDGKLWPGTYATITFRLPADPHVVQVPASALIFQKEGLQVATVGPGDKVALKSIRPGRDLGDALEVVGGLTPDERVIDSPPDALEEGERVRVASTPGGGLSGNGTSEASR